LIFSALMTPKGVVSKIINEKSNIQFFAPNFIFEEVNKHFDKILLHSPLTKFELIEALKILKEKIKTIETNTIPKEYIHTASEIVKDIDENDMFFVALSLFKKHKI
jgi:predicted nucleic acid-binding protein